jgi:hypothetical protein
MGCRRSFSGLVGPRAGHRDMALGKIWASAYSFKPGHPSPAAQRGMTEWTSAGYRRVGDVAGHGEYVR